MENDSILYPDDTVRSIAFKFTNATDTDKEVYIKDITLYSFLRNIDWVNNVFSWVELREIPLNKLAYNQPDNTKLLKIPILCCLRIPPGTYKNTESILAIINDRLSKMNEYGLAIKGAQALHNSPACAYDITDIAIRLRKPGRDAISWYPAVINLPAVLNDFDIKLINNYLNTDINHGAAYNVKCVPVLEYNDGELSLPSKWSPNYNNLSLYSSDLMSKVRSTVIRKGSSALTAHAIAFDNGITNTLNMDKINLTINDLYASEYGLIRYRENGNDYTEFIINPSNKELINEIHDRYLYTVYDIIGGNGNDDYPEITTEGSYSIFGCYSYPFFPVSTKLYIYSCNTPYVDKVIETRLSTERLFGISLASIEVNSECTNHTQTTTETDASQGRAAETLDIVTSVKPHVIPVNSIITIPHGSTTSIYVIGDNQHYPLWRSSHYLTYRVIN